MIIYRLVNDGKKSQTYPRSLCTDTSFFLEIDARQRNVRSTFDCTCAPLVHVHVRKKSGRLFIDPSIIRERESAKRTRAHFARTPFFFWRSKCARGMCEADSDCTRASLVQRRPSSFFFAVFHQIHQEIGGLVAVTFAPCCLTSHLLTGTTP